jgi:hypothetical protein
MARSTINKAAAKPVEPYLLGVAKTLVDRLYGPHGPAWGTKLTEIEDTLLAVRAVLTEAMAAEALRRQAAAVEEQPTRVRSCPKCGQEVAADEDEPRIMETRAGEAAWSEPKGHCRRCRRDFFPSEPESGDRPARVQSGGAGAVGERGDAAHIV